MQKKEEMEINPNLSVKARQDINLVQAAMNGDQQAFASLMDKYRDTIFYMLLKMVKNKSDADDLTIEAFGKAFKNIHQYTPNFAFSTWLFKIASNNCIDFLRKRKTETISIEGQTDMSGNEMPINIQSDSLDPEEDMIRQQKAILLRDIVDKLKPRYKELVTLRYFEEYSYDEIAVAMNIPIGTVKAQLFRARELLNNIMKNSQEKI
jgi:RNA polymerase sigma factor (sigma-70 family)